MALKILELNRELLEETAFALLDKEILEGDELRNHLNRVQAPPNMADWLHKGKLSVLEITEINLR